MGMCHGLSLVTCGPCVHGDENSMLIATRIFPPQFFCYVPRWGHGEDGDMAKMGSWWGHWGLMAVFFIGVEHMDILRHGDIGIWSMGRWGY